MSRQKIGEKPAEIQADRKSGRKQVPRGREGEGTLEARSSTRGIKVETDASDEHW